MSSYILAKKPHAPVLHFHCDVSYVTCICQVEKNPCCEYFVLTFSVLDLCVLQQNTLTVVYDF